MDSIKFPDKFNTLEFNSSLRKLQKVLITLSEGLASNDLAMMALTSPEKIVTTLKDEKNYQLLSEVKTDLNFLINDFDKKCENDKNNLNLNKKVVEAKFLMVDLDNLYELLTNLEKVDQFQILNYVFSLLSSTEKLNDQIKNFDL
jgi:hypothetical protein